MDITKQREYLKKLKKYLSENINYFDAFSNERFNISKTHLIIQYDNSALIGFHKLEWLNYQLKIREYQSKKELVVLYKRMFSKWRNESILSEKGLVCPLFFIIPTSFYSKNLYNDKISIQDLNNIEKFTNFYLKENPYFLSK